MKSRQGRLSLCQRGIRKVKRGDFAGAIADFNQSLQANPQLAPAYLMRGNARWKLGDISGAINDYTKAIAQNPKYAKAYYNRAIARAASQQRSKAIQDYRKAANLFLVQKDSDNRRRAVDNLTYLQALEQVRHNPNEAWKFYYQRSLKRFRAGDLQGALTDITRVADTRDDRGEIYCLRGDILRSLDNCGQAIDDYTRAIELEPQNVRAYYHRGLSYAKLQQLPQAAKDQTRAANLLFERGDVAEAKRIAKQVKALFDVEPIAESTPIQPKRPAVKRKRKRPRLRGKNRKLHQKLLKLVGGDANTVERLVQAVQTRHPHQDRQWYYEKAIFDLERDRQR